jgi:murein DD-endopeptidase MepM/ murein hydrolase activator NlpD
MVQHQLLGERRLDRDVTLRLALLDLGVLGPGIDAGEAALRPGLSPSALTGSGAMVRTAIDREGTPLVVEIETGEGHVSALCKTDEGFKLRTLDQPLRTDVAVVSTRLPHNADLVEALVNAGEHHDLAPLVAARLAWDVDFAVDTRPGDELQILVEKRWLGRDFHRYGRVLAVRYLGAAGRVGVYRYKPSGQDEDFFDGEGRRIRRKLLRSPIGWHPIDPETRAKSSPETEFVGGRIGTLYRRAEGAPVVAVGDGTVNFTGFRGDEGLVVELALDDATVVRYGHLGRILGSLEPGTRVLQGTSIATVGRSGKTPTARLRLEMSDADGKLLDPLQIEQRVRDSGIAASGSVLAQSERDGFEHDIAVWRQAMSAASRPD